MKKIIILLLLLSFNLQAKPHGIIEHCLMKNAADFKKVPCIKQFLKVDIPLPNGKKISQYCAVIQFQIGIPHMVCSKEGDGKIIKISSG